MNENIKKSEVVGKGDSTKKVDVKEVVNVEERIIPGGYKKISELTNEEIKALPRFKVTISCNAVTYNGNSRLYPSLILRLDPRLELVASRNDFTITDYEFLKMDHLVPKLNMPVSATSFEGNFPVRFCKGNRELVDGKINEFYYVQVFIKRGMIFSMYINKKNNIFNLFKQLVNNGSIPFNGWTFNDKVQTITPDNDDDNYLYE